MKCARITAFWHPGVSMQYILNPYSHACTEGFQMDPYLWSLWSKNHTLFHDPLCSKIFFGIFWPRLATPPPPGRKWIPLYEIFFSYSKIAWRLGGGGIVGNRRRKIKRKEIIASWAKGQLWQKSQMCSSKKCSGWDTLSHSLQNAPSTQSLSYYNLSSGCGSVCSLSPRPFRDLCGLIWNQTTTNVCVGRLVPSQLPGQMYSNNNIGS